MEKEFVIYQENGKKNTIYLNRFNRNRFFKEKLGKEGSVVYHFWLNDSLEEVYFKNVVFDGNIVIFDGDLKNRNIVFDNCTFTGKDISFSYCNVKMINPVFLNEDKVKIKVSNINDFNVDLSSDCVNVLAFNVRSCKNFSLNGNNNLCELMVASDNCCLKNVNNFRNLVLDVRKCIKLIDCNLKFESFNQSGLVKTDKLIMVDSSIVDGYRDDLGDVFSLSINSISGKNYEVKVKYDLTIHRDVYSNNGDDDYLVLFSSKDLSDRNLVLERRNLISVLKGISNSVNSNICTKVKEKEESYFDELIMQRKKLNKVRLALKQLQEKVNNDVDSYKDELSKQSVGKVMKLSKHK